MRILVTSPAGSVGSRVVRELMAPEFSVRVLTGEPERLDTEVREQVEVVRGSTDDLDTLLRALEEVESVFWCLPAEPLQVADVQGHYERHARAGSRALRQAGTPRVVVVSAGGKGLARNAGSITGLHRMEDILNESGAALRHLRCGLFMEELLSQAQLIQRHGLISYPLPGDVRLPMVAACDVADVALRWLVRRDWAGINQVPVHGPNDISFVQAAAVLERILERPVRYTEASANRYLQSLLALGAGAEYARGRVNMFAELTRGISQAEPRTAESTTPTTFTAWADMELIPRFQTFRPYANSETAMPAG